MTAVDFILSKESVLVATDTLALDENKRPLRFCTKVFPLPHIKCLICGVGSLQHLLRWFKFVEERCLVDNITVLNDIAKDILPKLKLEIEQEYKAEISSTIYHFGFNSITNEMEGYALRCNDNYIPQKMGDGIGVRPQEGIIDKINNNEISVSNHVELFIEFIKSQKLYDDNLPIAEKVGIGGEIQMFVLQKEGHYFRTIYRFEDYDKYYSDMLKCIK